MANNTSNNSASNFDSNKVCVVGCGFVGEHLLTCHSKTFDVYGYDVSQARVDTLTEHYKDNPNVHVSTDESVLENAGMYCISVPTLLKADNTIDDAYLKSAIATVTKYAQPGSCVVMESSVSVGMTRALLTDLRATGVLICHSPERVNPGMISPAVHEIPKLVSGYDNVSLERIKKYYSKSFDTIVPVSSMETSEMAKLYENCFRMINIAYVNEISDAATKHGIDPAEMLRACATKPFGYAPLFTPGLGVGGTCIFQNCHYLDVNNQLPLLMHAAKVTDERPATKAEEFVKKYPDSNNILVIGAGFKPGQSVTCASPALKYSKALDSLGKNVRVLDPLVKNFEGLQHISIDEFTVENVMKKFDKVVIGMRQTDIDYNVLSQLPSAMVVDAHLI